jgi:hypothetical protein
MIILRRVVLVLASLLLLTGILVIVRVVLPSDTIPKFLADPNNRSSYIINILAGFTEVALGAILVGFSDAVAQLIAVAFHRPSRDEYRERRAQEKLYLDNLIERFGREQPWDIAKYTGLDALQDSPSPTAYLARVSLWPLSNNDNPAVEVNPRSRVDIMRYLAKEKHPVMIKGEPGTGKTATVRKFAFELARRAQRRVIGRGKIPLYVSLALYTETETDESTSKPLSVVEFIQSYVKHEFPAATYLGDHLLEYLNTGQLVVLFDGLNEMPLPDYEARYRLLEQFSVQFSKAKFVFTCRTLRRTPGNFRIVTLTDLDDLQVKHFLRSYLGADLANRRYQDLTSGNGFMLRVCRNPFMLRMLVLGSPSRATPTSPAQLYTHFVADSLQRYTDNPARVSDAISQVAWAMQQAGIFAGEVSIQNLSSRVSAPDLNRSLQVACQAQLLDCTPDGKVRFYHQFLQEFFAAIQLRNLWMTEQAIDAYLTDLRWSETVLVCASIVDNPESLVRRVWAPGDSSQEAFWLAAKAVGSSGNRISEAYYKAIQTQAEGYLGLGEWAGRLPESRRVVAVDTVKALSYIDDEWTVEVLIKALLRHAGWIREVCIQTLARSRVPNARKEMRSAVARLHSINDTRLAAPNLSAPEQVLLAVYSTFSFDILYPAIYWLLILLLLVLPGIFDPLLGSGANVLRMDPLTFLL